MTVGLDRALPSCDDDGMAKAGPRKRAGRAQSPDELRAIPWSGEGPDPLEDGKGVPPQVDTFRFSERGRLRVETSERGVFDVRVLDGTAKPFGPYLLPARFRIEPRRDPSGRPSRLPAIDVEVVDGRPRCRALAARRADLTGPLLRELPIDSYIREASWRIARTKSRRKIAPRAWTLDKVSEEKIAAALKRRGPGARLDTELLEQVAVVWQTAASVNENTTMAVAEAMHCATSTANRWIKRARDLDLIPPPRGTR